MIVSLQLIKKSLSPFNLRQTPDSVITCVRAERVEEIRAQIEAGTYETDEKLDLALGRLLDERG